jgi:hypothetical protein
MDRDTIPDFAIALVQRGKQGRAVGAMPQLVVAWNHQTERSQILPKFVYLLDRPKAQHQPPTPLRSPEFESSSLLMRLPKSMGPMSLPFSTLSIKSLITSTRNSK